MLSKFLDPKNDVAFKKIFGTEKNQDILIHFLNDMLVFKAGKPITKVSFLKTLQDPEIAAKKTSIVDIMCIDEVGNQYIVEMQVAEGDGFIKRAQYYAAKAYSSQLKVAEKYHILKEIIFLAITNFIMFPEKKEFKSDHVILDKVTNEHGLKDFSFTFLELPKFKKRKEELGSIIDRWCYFFKHAEETSEKDLQEVVGKDLIIQRAYEGAPSEAHRNQLVKIQLTQRLTTSVKLNFAFEEVTNQVKPKGKMDQAATQVNVLSSEMLNIVEVDAFFIDGRQYYLGSVWLDPLALPESKAAA